MRFFLIGTLLSAGAMASADFALHWPVDCEQGRDCYIQNYHDNDPGPGHADFTCGPLSYDTHRGTDIALPLRSDLNDSVAVLAAAPGRVTGVRDGMEDTLYTGQDLEGRDCGNGVVVDHGDGWVTQYCHLRKGSIVVGDGAKVEAGTKLGEIGLSGRTQFPHLHLALRKDGTPIDPFRPAGTGTCGAPSATLWADDVPYVAGGLLDIGFATGVPEYDAIKAGTARQRITPDAPLVFFGFAFGGRPGDVMRVTITGPQGEVLRQDNEITRNRAQFFRANGKRAPEGGWPKGRYSGIAELIRDGGVIDVRSLTTWIR